MVSPQTDSRILFQSNNWDSMSLSDRLRALFKAFATLLVLVSMLWALYSGPFWKYCKFPSQLLHPLPHLLTMFWSHQSFPVLQHLLFLLTRQDQHHPHLLPACRPGCQRQSHQREHSPRWNYRKPQVDQWRLIARRLCPHLWCCETAGNLFMAFRRRILLPLLARSSSLPGSVGFHASQATLRSVLFIVKDSLLARKSAPSQGIYSIFSLSSPRNLFKMSFQMSMRIWRSGGRKLLSRIKLHSGETLTPILLPPLKFG